MTFIIPDKWLTTEEVAKLLRVSAKRVANWRRTKKGPTYTKMGGLAMYKMEDIERWLAVNTFEPSKTKDRAKVA